MTAYQPDRPEETLGLKVSRHPGYQIPKISDIEKTGVYADETVTVIVETLRNRLQKTHALRRIK
jgi:hypothetical protein